MSRLGQWGGELGHEHAEGLALTGTALTFDTGTKRTGTRSFKFTSSAPNYLQYAISGGATGRSYYACGHILLPVATGLPGSSAWIMNVGLGTGAATSAARLTTTGKLQLWAGTVQIGSDSIATLTTDTWYRVELRFQSGSGAIDIVELLLDGVSVASSSTANVTDAAPSAFNFGWVEDPGTSEVIHFDDVVLNDSQGSVNNTWVGNQKVYALLPLADSARTNWTAGGAGTTSLFDAANNIPPVGVLPAAGVAATAQIQNAVSAAGAAYDATMTDPTTAGVGSTDLITAIIPVVELGSSSTTGTDTLTHSVVSNPAIAGTAGSCDIVSGTYPASWNRSQGVITENPSVALGTAPVMRIVKDVASTRINSCCLMAMSVAVNPNAAPTAQRYRSIMMVGD